MLIAESADGIRSVAEPEGLEGEITTKSRPLKDGETMEWVLLSGVSATAASMLRTTDNKLLF